MINKEKHFEAGLFTPDGEIVARCGHRHGTASEAFPCGSYYWVDDIANGYICKPILIKNGQYWPCYRDMGLWVFEVFDHKPLSDVLLRKRDKRK